MKGWVNLLTWLLIGCSVVHSCAANQKPDWLIDSTLDYDYNSKVPASDGRPGGQEGGGENLPRGGRRPLHRFRP